MPRALTTRQYDHWDSCHADGESRDNPPSFQVRILDAVLPCDLSAVKDQVWTMQMHLKITNAGFSSLGDSAAPYSHWIRLPSLFDCKWLPWLPWLPDQVWVGGELSFGLAKGGREQLTSTWRPLEFISDTADVVSSGSGGMIYRAKLPGRLGRIITLFKAPGLVVVPIPASSRPAVWAFEILIHASKMRDVSLGSVATTSSSLGPIFKLSQLP